MRIKTTSTQLSDALHSLSTNGSFQESAKRLAAGEQPHDMVRAMAACPAILQAMESLGTCVYPGGGTLPRELKELIILQSSIHNACQFCTQSHIDIARSVGMGDEPVALLENPEALPAPYRAALCYAELVRSDSNRITDEQFAAVAEHFSPGEIVQLTFLIGYINMLNWFNNALQIEYRGELTT